MSILIKGMEMPFVGSIKTIVIYPDGTVRTRRQDPLPYTAVPVPPHGRLIDSDEAIGHLFIGEQCLYSWDEIEESIDATTTIIEAEEGET